MLELALIGSTALLGVAGMAHCTAMCGAACTAITSGRGGAAGAGAALDSAATGASAAGRTWAFHLARVASYAVGGAVAAGSVAVLAGWSQASPALRPFWTLLHVAALALGVYLLWRGQQPAWMSAIGRVQRPPAPSAEGWQRVQFPVKAAAAGSLWVAWPCGLLQSALLVAAMANGPAGGAAAMAAFAVTSSGGLLLAPWAWRRWAASPSAQLRAVRLAGLMLAGASAFALLHGLYPPFAAFCATL